MSGRAVVSVAANSGHYVAGMDRLSRSLDKWGEKVDKVFWRDKLPRGSRPHQTHPYSFKAFALREAAERGFTKLLWADSCIVLNAPLERIWQRAAEHGAWISRNGWVNSTWTTDASYPILFPGVPIEEAREVNRKIEHVVATTFALDLDHPIGRRIFNEYVRLGTETDAFCGPWFNSNWPGHENMPLDWRCQPCGPPECRGGRHDQVVLSVAAWRCDLALTSAPDFFCYQGSEIETTIVVADGGHKRPL